MSSVEIGKVLAEIRAAQARSAGPLARPEANAGSPVDFGSMLKNSIDKVADLQNKAESMAAAYEAGDKSVDLTKVMLEVQKASLAFRAMTEVRNKLVDAYREVMSMPV
jgi:flagellar hook-basal body complex protein FliE